MEYRFKSKERRTKSILKGILNRFKFKENEVGGDIFRKKILVLAIAIVIIIVAFFITSSTTGYFLYTEDIKAKLNRTTSERDAALAEKEQCGNDLFRCAENLDVCRSDFSSKSELLSQCSSEKSGCIIDRDICRNNYSELNVKYSICVDDRGMYKTRWEECNINYTSIQEDYSRINANLSATRVNYRNLACCVAKLGQSGVSKMYWRFSGNKAECQTTQSERFAEIAVSELGC